MSRFAVLVCVLGMLGCSAPSEHEKLLREVAQSASGHQGAAVVWRGRPGVDLADYDRLIPASDVRRRGFARWVGRSGEGAPAVLYRGASEGQAFVSRLGTAMPVTAVRVGDGRGGHRLELFDTLDENVVRIGGRRVVLGVDYTAPLAYLRSQNRQPFLGLRGLLSGEHFFEETGLYRMQAVDTDKVPVVFVHGLKSSPGVWRQLVNEARADSALRGGYQFWFFSYPSGMPIAYSAMRLRESLQQMQATYNPRGENPAMKRCLIVGHSMGALIAEMQLKDSGEAFLPAGMPSLAGLELSAEHEVLVRKTVFFERQHYISRAVFIAAPHHGSDAAGGRGGRLLSSLVRLPKTVTDGLMSLVVSPPQDRERPGTLANSIDNMRTGSPFILALRSVPIPADLPFHSVIADHFKHDPEELSNDGFVKYESAHLPGVRSEAFVRSSHGAYDDEETITEVLRVMRLHLLEK